MTCAGPPRQGIVDLVDQAIHLPSHLEAQIVSKVVFCALHQERGGGGRVRPRPVLVRQEAEPRERRQERVQSFCRCMNGGRQGRGVLGGTFQRGEDAEIQRVEEGLGAHVAEGDVGDLVGFGQEGHGFRLVGVALVWQW